MAKLSDKAFFDWMRNQQDDSKLSQDMVDGANALLALMSADELKAVLGKIKAWQHTPADNPATTLPEGFVTPNFSMAELTHSNTAVRRGMSNQPNSAHRQNLIESCENLWQPMRDLLDVAVIINSGYRSPAVNKAVGGSRSSAHSIGCAIDFIAPKFGDTRKIAAFLVKALKEHGIKFDQLILEFPDSPNSWIHLGYKNGRGEQRCQVLTAKKGSGRTRYSLGLS